MYIIYIYISCIYIYIHMYFRIYKWENMYHCTMICTMTTLYEFLHIVSVGT